MPPLRGALRPDGAYLVCICICICMYMYVYVCICMYMYVMAVVNPLAYKNIGPWNYYGFYAAPETGSINIRFS